MTRLALACWFVFSFPGRVALAQNAQAALPDPILDRILTTHPKARAVVALRLDPTIESRSQAIAQAASLAIQNSSANQLRVHSRFQRVPALIVTLNPAALTALRANPSVIGVEWDGGGYGLTIAPEPVNKLDHIAVLDTGLPLNAELGAPDKLASESCFCRLEHGAGCCPDGSHHQDGPGSTRDDLSFETTSQAWLRATLPPNANVPSWAPAIVVVKVLSRHDQFDSWDSIFTALDHLLDRDQSNLNRVLFSFASSRLYTAPDCAASATAAVLRDVMAEFIRQGVVPMAARAPGGPGPGLALPGCLQLATQARASVTERLPQPSFGGGEMPMPGTPGGPPPAPLPSNASIVYGVIESIAPLADADIPPIDTPANVKWSGLRVRVFESVALRNGVANLVAGGQSLTFATYDSTVGLGPGQAIKFSASLARSVAQPLYFATGFRLVDNSETKGVPRRPL